MTETVELGLGKYWTGSLVRRDHRYGRDLYDLESYGYPVTGTMSHPCTYNYERGGCNGSLIMSTSFMVVRVKVHTVKNKMNFKLLKIFRVSNSSYCVKIKRS